MTDATADIVGRIARYLADHVAYAKAKRPGDDAAQLDYLLSVIACLDTDPQMAKICDPGDEIAAEIDAEEIL